MNEKPWIIVTGGSGLIGRELIELLRSEFEIASLDLAEVHAHSCESGVHRFKVDLGDPPAIEAFFAVNRRPIAGFINLAAYYSFSNRPSPHYQRLLSGLKNLAFHYKNLRTPSARFVQASSMSCLKGIESFQKIPSEAPSYARWEYPRFKKESEEILRAELVSEAYVEFVLAAVYTDDCELVPLYQFLEAHLHTKIQRWFYPGNINRGLTYVHLSDVAIAFQRQLTSPLLNRRLLIGEPGATTYGEIASIADQEIHGFSLPKLRIPKWFAKVGAFCLSLIFRKEFYRPWMINFAEEHYVFELKNTEEQLQWKPNHSLKQSLPKMIQQAIAHPNRWRKINEQRPWSDNDWPQLNEQLK